MRSTNIISNEKGISCLAWQNRNPLKEPTLLDGVTLNDTTEVSASLRTPSSIGSEDDTQKAGYLSEYASR